MGNYLNKHGLYSRVEQLRRDMRLDGSKPVNFFYLCGSIGMLSVKEVNFTTYGLRGMAAPSRKNGQPDIILLANHYEPIEKNFNCGHELMHLLWHREEPVATFQCFETVRKSQNAILEWQANEGTAALLVPYYRLLMQIKSAYPCLTTWERIEELKKELAFEYQVSDTVIEYRLESLKFEIIQYLNGTELEYIRLLSAREQQKQGIVVKSLNDIANDFHLIENGFYMPLNWPF